MLRIIQNRSAGYAKNYYSESDYLSEGQELTGIWGGKGADLIGLSGDVQKEHFDRLCDNLHPISGARLTARTNSDRTVGYDFNFHVPKSVSIAYALGQDDRIVDVLRESVEATMNELEHEAKTRVRKYGLDTERTTGNLVWSTFVHTTARPIDGVPDPHLHAHAFVFNTTWDDKEQAWKAGQFRDLKRDAPYFEAAFHARLSLGMRALGYDVQKQGKAWEIMQVPKSIAKKFSRRTDQIEKLAEEMGVKNVDEKAELAAKTREAKNKTHTMSELRDIWHKRLSGDEAWSIEDLKNHPVANRELAPTKDRELDSMAWAKLHSFERHSVIPAKQLLAEALRYGIGHVSVEGIHAQLESQKVIVRDIEGRKLATTPEMLMEEQAMIRFARDGKNTVKSLQPSWTIKRDWLNEDQQKAVKHVLESPDRVIMVKGGAGTGKTSLMKEAIEAIETNGFKVFTFAPSAEASRGVLATEGLSATTVAELLVSKSLQEELRGNVMWIDEAGLLGTRTTKQVFDIAKEVDARVILSGDYRQHGSVEAGAAMRVLEQEAKLKPANVRSIQRQSGEYKQAVALLAEGKTYEGLSKLDRLGWIKEISDDDQRYELIARDYAYAVTAGESVLAIAPTHAEGERLTNEIRQKLKEREIITGNELSFEQLQSMRLTEAEKGDAERVSQGNVIVFHGRSGKHVKGERIDVETDLPSNLKTHAKKFDVYERKAFNLAQGDRLRITGNGKTKDGQHRLNNGSIYRVKGFTKQGDIQLENHWIVAKDYGHLAPGYVTTSHASQGKTVDHVLIAESNMSFPAASREQFYVSVSRGRQSATIYTNDRNQLTDAVLKSDPRVSATELVKQSYRERRLKQQRIEQLRQPSKSPTQEREQERIHA